jgi:hypothetical protein
MTKGAIEVAEKLNDPTKSGGLIHEHVWERSKVADQLLVPGISEAQIDSIMEDVLPCTVTKDEHSKLHTELKLKHLDGWKRYEDANIEVWNTATGTRLI